MTAKMQCRTCETVISRAPGGQDAPAPQRDADQHQPEDVTGHEQVGAEPDGRHRPHAVQQPSGQGQADADPGRGQRDVVRPAMVDQNRLMAPANDSTSPAVPSRGALRRGIRPTAMTPECGYRR
jgi:hypothetical protein